MPSWPAGPSIAESKKADDQYKYQRVYRQPLKYAALTGYYSYIYGRSGVEASQNAILSGSDPRLFVNRVVDMVGNSSPKGGSVSLTIDPKAQTAAYDGLRALGGKVEGSVVALDPTTGKVLAMVTSPTYDPNLLASHRFSAVQTVVGQAQRRPRAGRYSTGRSRRSTLRDRPSSWSPRRLRSPAVSTPRTPR